MVYFFLRSTSSSTRGNLIKLFYKTKRYGEYSITVSAVESRNKIQKQLKYLLLRDLSPDKIKAIVSDHAKIISDFKACVRLFFIKFLFFPK